MVPPVPLIMLLAVALLFAKAGAFATPPVFSSSSSSSSSSRPVPPQHSHEYSTHHQRNWRQTLPKLTSSENLENDDDIRLTPSIAAEDREDQVESEAEDENLDKHEKGDEEDPNHDRIPYSWKDQWYALTFSSYVPQPSESAETTAAAVFDHPLVLWRSQDDGPIYCADDVCPHRATALTEGRVRNGTLECYYHGWQFSGRDNGACVRIPQLALGASLPGARACLKMRPCRESEGIVWVWMGDEQAPDRDPPATGRLNAEGQEEGINVYDMQIDLPYDHSYLVENLLDPAHIAISHDQTPGGGNRKLAEGYEMLLDDDSLSMYGFTGRFRPLSRQASNGPFTNFTFEAPGIIRNEFEGQVKGRDLLFCGALHCMPLGFQRSRLLFRVYNRGLPRLAVWMTKLKPLWLRHLNSCKVLEQDVGLITTQEDHFARNSQREPQQDYLLLQSSDVYVGAYRKWMDRVGHGMPWFQGLAQSANMQQRSASQPLPPALAPAHHRASNQNVVETRYHRHVLQCPTTRNALKKVKRYKRFFAKLGGVTLTVLCALLPRLLLASSLTVSARTMSLVRAVALVLPVTLAGGTAMHLLEQEFYVSFKRKDQLRRESGLLP